MKISIEHKTLSCKLFTYSLHWLSVRRPSKLTLSI